MPVTIRILITLGFLLFVATVVTGQDSKSPSPGAAELASIRAYARQVDRFITFYGNVTAIRDKYYGSTGKLLRTTTRYLDMQTQKPKKSPNFQAEPIPVYLTVQGLPFNKLL